LNKDPIFSFPLVTSSRHETTLDFWFYKLTFNSYYDLYSRFLMIRGFKVSQMIDGEAKVQIGQLLHRRRYSQEGSQVKLTQ
jgi:hypothetical protein